MIQPYTIVRIRARVGMDSPSGSPLGELEDVIGLDASDSELNEYARKLQEPITYTDPLLGEFTLNRRVDWFEAEAVWEGETIWLNLSAKGSADLQPALKTAHSLWQDQSVWNQRIRDYAVEDLLPLKNDAWLDEDEEEVTPDQFTERMTLESITVYPDGSFTFWHDDGGLFWGHAIQISSNLTEGPTDADIPG